MSQKIATLENKKRILENKVGSLEKENRKLELKAEKAQVYRKQLIKLVFDPDTIQ